MLTAEQISDIFYMWDEAQSTVEHIARKLNVSEETISDIIFPSEPPEDYFRDDVEADANTFASCGWGTDEDYYPDGEWYDDSDNGEW
jgi:hypothetical protein